MQTAIEGASSGRMPHHAAIRKKNPLVTLGGIERPLQVAFC